MKVEIEEIGPCKKLLKIEISKEKIEDEWQNQLSKLRGLASIPGFRKGKAPIKLVEKKFNDRLMGEVEQMVVSGAYQEAIENNKLSPVGEPEISNINLELGKPLNFEVTMEVLPTFELGEYKGIRLKKMPVSVTEKDINEALNGLCKMKTQLKDIKKGKVKDGDYIICDCKVTVDGKEVKEDKDLEIMTSGSTVADINVPDLKTKLSGAASGEKRSIKVELGDNFSVEQHRNKPAELEISVKEIKKPSSPKIDDEFAKQMDYDSLDELKDVLTKKLEVEKKKQADSNLREQIYEKLLGMANFEVPKDTIENQAEKRLYRYQMELLNKGTPMGEIQKNLEELKNTTEEFVIRDFKFSLVLEKIAEKEKIFVTESEIDQRIKILASMYGTEPSKMRGQLEKIGNIPNLRYQMKEDKTIDFIMKEAVIEETDQEKKK